MLKLQTLENSVHSHHPPGMEEMELITTVFIHSFSERIFTELLLGTLLVSRCHGDNDDDVLVVVEELALGQGGTIFPFVPR